MAKSKELANPTAPTPDQSVMTRHDKEKRRAATNSGFKEMAGFVVVSSAVHLIIFVVG